MAKKTHKQLHREKTQKKKRRKGTQILSPYLRKKDQLDREARELDESPEENKGNDN